MASGMPAFEMVFRLNSMRTSWAVDAMTARLLPVDLRLLMESRASPPKLDGRPRPSLHRMRMTHRAVTVLVLLHPSNLPNQHEYGIIEFVHHALFQRNDRIVCDVDLLGANFGAALGD